MDENDCLICFEDLDSRDKALLSCNHVIHFSCLQEWIKKKKNVTQLCPICNNDGEIINIIDANPIFKESQYYSSYINPNNSNGNSNGKSNGNSNCNYNIEPKTSVVKNVLFGCCNIL
jgi:hypothetical protein